MADPHALRPIFLGGAQTDFARNWTREGRSFLDVLGDVVPRALEDAAVPVAEIARLGAAGRVGVHVGNFQADQFLRQAHLGAFLTEVDPAFDGVPGARYEAACASGSIALHAAATAIHAGIQDLAVVVGIEIMRSVGVAEGNDILGAAAIYEDEARGVPFVFPVIFGQLTDAILARAARRGVGEGRVLDALSEISRTNFANAKRNPHAQTRGWDTRAERLAAKDLEHKETYGGRTRYSDCCQVTDGAAAVLLASPAYAHEHLRKAGRAPSSTALLAGWGHRNAPVRFARKLAEADSADFLMPWTRRAVDDAYARAGVTAADIDVFETHDCFTSTELVALGAFGIAEPDAEIHAVEEGRIAFEGPKPVNPSGGLIGGGHPVGATGVRMALDLLRQVTDRAGDFQVPGARTGAMLNIGGSLTTNMSFVVARGG